MGPADTTIDVQDPLSDPIDMLSETNSTENNHIHVKDEPGTDQARSSASSVASSEQAPSEPVPCPRPQACNIQPAQLKTIFRSTKQLEYIFGPVPERVKIDGETYKRPIPVGRKYDSREEAREAGIHKSAMGGIAGSQDVGSPSIAMNGGYEDNQDYVYTFDYTGAGGKKSIENQSVSMDQKWSSSNLALLKSYNLGYPVRLLRGEKAASACAPVQGYRYDGLYQIVLCWIQRSNSFEGHKVIKFAFQRLPGQDPIVRDGKVFKEDDFIRTGLTRDWVKLPSHFFEVQRGTHDPPDPSVIDLGDGMGVLTPAEWLRQNRGSSGRAAGGPHRTSSSSSRRSGLPYSLAPRPAPIILDMFGNVIEQKLPQTRPLTQVTEQKVKKIVPRSEPYPGRVYRELVAKLRIADPPTMSVWRERCEAAGKIVDPY